MSKSKEELNKIKEEVETLNKKLHKLTDEQLEKVNGGTTDCYLFQRCPNCHVGHLERFCWSGRSFLACVDEENPYGGCGFEVEE